MHYGTLRVTTPDGQVREYPIDVPSAFVGRAEANRVVIDHVTVSRRHARLTIDSGRLMVEDLGSATGTFLGSQRIPPHSPSLAEEGQAIRFGDVEARFLGVASGAFAAEAPPAGIAPLAGTASVGPGGASPPLAPAAPPPLTAAQGAAQPISVSVKSPAAPVAAGSPTTATVVLQNRGTVVDEFSLSVPDLPPAWVRISRPNLRLLPGSRDEVTIVLHPPRGPEALAKEYSFAVAIVSRELGIEVRALGRFTLLPFDGFQMALNPVRATRDFDVVVRNTGNAPAAYSLSGTDDEGSLQFRFESDHLDLQPGEERSIGLEVRTKSRRWFGEEEVKSFRAEARPATPGLERHAADGQLRSRATLQAWRWLIILALVGGTLGAAAWGYTQTCRDGWPVCGDGKATTPGEPTTTVPTVTQQPGRPTVSATSVPTTAPTAPPTTRPTGLRPGITAVVTNSPAGGAGNGNCLAVRNKPEVNPSNLNDGVLRRLCDGAEVTIVAGPTNDGTYLFWQIRDSVGEGWAAEGAVAGGERWLVPK